MADYEKQSNALFNLTPSCLDLVDLDKRTVDKEFIYTDDKDKELMWELEEDPDKKAVYEKILIDLGILCPF
jgi:hypothetical protein